MPAPRPDPGEATADGRIADNIVYFARALRKAGMETLAITEGLSALDELDRFRPELILMDLYMPDVDGMENEYLSDVGLQFENEMAHGMVKGAPSTL